MGTVYAALSIAMSILGALLLPVRGTGEAYGQVRSLLKVSASRARVLCPTCHSENDDGHNVCQWCGNTVSAPYRQVDGKRPVKIDEDAISRRYRQFTAAWAEKASTKSRSSTWNLFSRFLESRSYPGATCIEATQPKDVVEYLCWLDSCGTRRRTAVHAHHCSAVGTKDLTACSTKPGECNLRYVHDSLRSNHVSKVGMVFKKELGVVDSWSSTLRIGNPVRSDLATQYMAFTTEEQKQAGVLVKQAPTILRSYLAQILLPMRTHLQITTSDVDRVTLARDIAFFAVAFSTTKRGAELSTATLIQRILRLPNKSGLMFNFQYGKIQRDGADHILTVPYDEEYVAVCPVRAVTQLIDIGKGVGWDMTRGHLLSEISCGRDGKAIRGSLPISAATMSAALKTYAQAAGETQEFSLHSFQSGGALTRALAGDSLSTVLQRAYWKNPKTAWRYIRLMEVVAPGSEGSGMVAGNTEDQYRQLNEFPLSEQTRSLAAFSGRPLL